MFHMSADMCLELRTCLYIYHFLETAQTDFIEIFESKTQALARQCFHFQNGLNPSFMPTQQGPNRALTESSANQFYLIRQLNFQKLDLASQFLFIYIYLYRLTLLVPLKNIHSIIDYFNHRNILK
ncbi:Hypothetical_protein [Hexamita inflata]|uniref:Hypothetical_protein n=1 Tax=Hexamita inflata TaxID=28002 RepID=A0AA86QPI1_9EUKA|nr:Hypothetical protein HINF_LOCUS45622 [Hexamita inflata]